MRGAGSDWQQCLELPAMAPVAGGGHTWGGQRCSGHAWGGWRRHLGATDERAWGRRRISLGQAADAPVASLGAFDRVARCKVQMASGGGE
jgi:hypothetical protein